MRPGWRLVESLLNGPALSLDRAGWGGLVDDGHKWGCLPRECQDGDLLTVWRLGK